MCDINFISKQHFFFKNPAEKPDVKNQVYLNIFLQAFWQAVMNYLKQMELGSFYIDFYMMVPYRSMHISMERYVIMDR